MRSWLSAKRWDLLALTVLTVAIIAALIPFWAPGLPNLGDFLMSVHRIFELNDAASSGILYPRFGINLNFGYTAPLFEYYPPLASYIGLIFNRMGLGFIASAKAVLSLSLLLSGWGVYIYVRHLLKHRLAAFVSAFVYFLSPYLLMVIYERGAVAESLTWAFLPWLLWAAHRYAEVNKRWYGLAVALLVAMTMLGHNATAMFVIPVAALYVAVLAWLARDLKALARVAGAFILGVGMGAFYWLPALAEMGLTKANEVMFRGGTSVEANVKPLAELAQSTLFHQYAGPERFRFATWQLLAGAAGALYQIIFWRRRPRILWFWVGILAFVLLIQFDFSLPFWQNMPIVRYIQFPWRLYGLAAFAIAILFGAFFAGVRLESWRNAWKPIGAAAGLLALFAWFSLTHLRPDQLPLWHVLQESDISRTAMWTKGQEGYPLFGDYTLKTLSIDDRGLALSRPSEDPTRLPPTAAPQSIEVRAANPIRYVLDVNSSQPWTLRLHRPYFPGWQVSANGAPLTTGPGGVAGLVSTEIPAGQYQIVASLEDSPIRRAANLASILSLAIWLIWMLPRRRWWIDGTLVVVLSLVIWGAINFLQHDGRPSRHPTSNVAQFEEGIRLLGYDLPAGNFCAGQTGSVRLYWFASQSPLTDYKLFVHLMTPDDTAKVAQVDTMPFGGFNPMTRWEPGEVVDFDQTIELDSTITPGQYQLLLGLYNQESMQNLRVIAAPNVLPGDRVHVADIEVKNCAP